jgi:hypothetical protein
VASAAAPSSETEGNRIQIDVKDQCTSKVTTVKSNTPDAPNFESSLRFKNQKNDNKTLGKIDRSRITIRSQVSK